MSYNSLVWIKYGTTMYFEPDKSNVSPGFRLGFPVIEPVYYDSAKSKWVYLMMAPSGARIEFRQISASNSYETGDSTYAKLTTAGAASPNDPVENIIHKVPIVDYSSAIERVTYAPYPKTGTPLPVDELHMVDPAAGAARPVQLDTRDATVWMLGWRPTVAEAIVMRLSRTGKRLDLFAIEPTGATRLLASDERPGTFVGALDFTTENWAWQVTALPDDSGFLYGLANEQWRTDNARFHRLGTPIDQDIELFKEADEGFRVGVSETSSRKWIVIASGDLMSSCSS